MTRVSMFWCTGEPAAARVSGRGVRGGGVHGGALGPAVLRQVRPHLRLLQPRGRGRGPSADPGIRN